MPTRQNRYFNNPQIAGAMSNLAGLFAPPSAQDFYAMSRTEGQDYQNEAQRRAFEALIAEGVTPQDQDRFGVAMTTFGQGFNPTQTNRAVDIQSADRRYGTDVGAQNALDVQAMRGQQSARESAFVARTNPQGAQGISDEDIAATLGVEVPGFSTMQPVAPTDAQVLGANRQSMIDEIPGLREALATDGIGGTNVMTPEGPRIMPSGQAALSGAEPYINTGQAPATKPIILVDSETGQQFPGVFDPATSAYSFSDGSQVDMQRFVPQNLPQAQGSSADVGGTTTMQNRETERFSSAGQALDVIADLRTSLRNNPGAAGVAGSLQRLSQNLVATVDEFSQAFGGRTPTMAELMDSGGAEIVGPAGQDLTRQYFNPALPEIQFMTNQVIWAYVSAQQGSGRVSNQQLEEARAYLGADQWLSNNQAFDAALNIMERDLRRTQARAEATGLVPRTVIESYRPGQGAPGGAPGGAGASGAEAAPGGAGGRIRYDADGNQIR